MNKLMILLFLTFTLPCTLYAKETPNNEIINNAIEAQTTAFCSNQILAHPIDHGYTWTLTSRLGQLLNMAEEEYGERDKSWTLLGVEFTSGASPKNWHPMFSKGNNDKNIIIQLTQKAAKRPKEAIFELSHEVFHVLMPTGDDDSTFFEEGLATYFSIKATQETGIDISPDYIASPKYRRAYELTRTLYQQHPNASGTIKRFRKMGIQPSSLDAKQLTAYFPYLEKDIATALAKQFNP